MPDYFKAPVLSYANDFPLEIGRYFRRQMFSVAEWLLMKKNIVK
jgi:hypothetical protein